MLIEIRWVNVGLLEDNNNRFRTAEFVAAQLEGEQYLGLKLQVLRTYPASYESIGVDSPSWLEVQTKFEFGLLPRIRKNVSEFVEIRIEGRTLGAWAADLEQTYVLLREEAHRAVRDLRETRRFFRHRPLEVVRKRLEATLTHFCKRGPSRPPQH